MYIPSVGEKGAFKFNSPFDTGDIQDRLLEVTAIRSLTELYQDGLDPLNRIYIQNGLKEAEYEDDLKSNIPVVVLRTEGNKFYYVPANRISQRPITTGINYKRYIVHVNLGNLPEDYPLNPIVTDIEDVIKNYTGLKGQVEIVPTSEKLLFSDDEHNAFMAKLGLTSKARNRKSFSVQLAELERKYNLLNDDYKALQEFMSKTWNNNVMQSVPNPDDLELYTKKVRIDVVSPTGLDYRATLGGLCFYRRNSFNKNPIPIYAVGLNKNLDIKQSYNGVMDKTRFKITLEEGDLGTQPLSNIFSDNYNIKLSNDPKDEVSRGTIIIEFEEKVNIRDFEIRLAYSASYNCSRCRVVFYNDQNTIIYNQTFEKDKDFEEEEGLGKNQTVKVEDIKLTTTLPQGDRLPELISVHP